MYNNLKDELKKINGLEIKYNIPLKEYTSFKIGGPVDIFAAPDSSEQLQQLITTLHGQDLPIFILGRGSNIIVGDKGYRGIIIYTGKLNRVDVEGRKITAETGITLAALANTALEAGLTGLEFASGIPGSLGGAVYMNAGAYGGEMKDVIENVLLFDYQGNKITLSNEELRLSYRHSIIQEKPLIVVEVNLILKPGKKDEIKAKIKNLNQRRKDKQPLEFPSAGSIFKRPTGYYTGPLIEKAGLKGLRVGDAQVSEKHAGFIINLGNATPRNVRDLIDIIQKKIEEETGIKLEVEPKFIGEFE